VLHGRILRRRAPRPNAWSPAGLAYVHGFDDPYIIAGQGTWLEILEQVPIWTPLSVLSAEAAFWRSLHRREGAQARVQVIAVESVATGNLTAAFVRVARFVFRVTPRSPTALRRSRSVSARSGTSRVGSTGGPRGGEVDLACDPEMLELEKTVVEGRPPSRLPR